MGTQEGLFARVSRLSTPVLRVKSTTWDGEVHGPRELPLEEKALLALAQDGGFWSYVAGTAYRVVVAHRVGGLVRGVCADVSQQWLVGSVVLCVTWPQEPAFDAPPINREGKAATSALSSRCTQSSFPLLSLSPSLFVACRKLTTISAPCQWGKASPRQQPCASWWPGPSIRRAVNLISCCCQHHTPAQ